MKPMIVFAGTVEGRLLTQRLAEAGLHPAISVATDYGASLLEDLRRAGARVFCGRLNRAEIADLLRREGFSCAIDATHPYAAAVTEALANACRDTGCPYLRLRRESLDNGPGFHVSNVSQAVSFLHARNDRVLLTTGSKDLPAFTQVHDFSARLYPRILPLPDAIRTCLELGYRADHLIAMQGPFSQELNAALLTQFSIGVLVTKDTGTAGGFAQKRDAAQAVGVDLLILGRPPEIHPTLPFDELLNLLLSRSESSGGIAI